MNLVSALGDHRAILRWGGVAGMASGLVLLVVFGIVAVFVGTDPAQPAGLIERFPGIRAARVVENGLYLAVIAMWYVHLTALSDALGGSRPAPAIFGRSLATLGIFALAAGALPHIATDPISNLYHAPGLTAAQQAALVPLWLATQGIFDALLATGLLLLPLGLIGIALAMRQAPGFGRTTPVLAIAFGVIGFGTAVVNLVAPSEIAAIGVFALIAFHLLVGWKTLRLSRLPGSADVSMAEHRDRQEVATQPIG